MPQVPGKQHAGQLVVVRGHAADTVVANSAVGHEVFGLLQRVSCEGGAARVECFAAINAPDLASGQTIVTDPGIRWRFIDWWNVPEGSSADMPDHILARLRGARYVKFDRTHGNAGLKITPFAG